MNNLYGNIANKYTYILAKYKIIFIGSGNFFEWFLRNALGMMISKYDWFKGKNGINPVIIPKNILKHPVFEKYIGMFGFNLKHFFVTCSIKLPHIVISSLLYLVINSNT